MEAFVECLAQGHQEQPAVPEQQELALLVMLKIEPMQKMRWRHFQALLVMLAYYWHSS